MVEIIQGMCCSSITCTSDLQKLAKAAKGSSYEVLEIMLHNIPRSITFLFCFLQQCSQQLFVCHALLRDFPDIASDSSEEMLFFWSRRWDSLTESCCAVMARYIPSCFR